MSKKNLNPTLNEYLLSNEVKLRNNLYLIQPRQGRIEEFTWGDVVRKARQVAAFLKESGFKTGDKIAICSKNCAEWYIVDFGISLAGMITVPLFPNQRNELIHFVLIHAEVKAVFIGKLDDPLRISQCMPQLMPLFSMGYHEIQNVIPWVKVMCTPPLEEVYYPNPDDIFTIIYTSGTSGSPKGVVYTHGKIAAYLALYCLDIKTICDIPVYRFLSYLPLAHIYERSSIELGSVMLPCTVSFMESIDKFVDNLRETRPTFFTGVPRIWSVFHSRITRKISEKKLFFLLKIPGVSCLLKRKIKRSMGFSECKNFFSGASHLPTDLLRFFNKIDIKIQEGYGQSENLAYATVAHLDNYRIGYVGTARFEVELKLSPKRELLIKSPCLMDGYYNDSAATEAALSKDGWLHTGDIARIDKKNRVKIIDRLSDIFKSQHGEFISPNEIEERFSNLDYFEHVCLIGKNLPDNVLIVALSNTGHRMDKEELVKKIQNDIRPINQQLAKYEKVSKLFIVKDDWIPENGFLTPTFKVRRPIIEAQYRGLIEQVLMKPGLIFWEKEPRNLS